MITEFNEYSKINESIKLSKDEKDFLWKKLEYRKKKTAEEKENKLFDILKGEQDEIKSDDFKIILNALEYTFKKKITGQDKPMKLEVFIKLMDKIPNDWFGVKYSSLEAHKKKLKREEEQNKKPDKD